MKTVSTYAIKTVWEGQISMNVLVKGIKRKENVLIFWTSTLHQQKKIRGKVKEWVEVMRKIKEWKTEVEGVL